MIANLVLPLALALGPLVSQTDDPVRTLPDAYKLQFENEWVKIVSVRYPPKATLPAHDHPDVATAYVYLNDAGPVVFRHTGRGAVTRPPTKAGSFRLFRANKEHHAVENTSDTTSEFLRVQFKTDPKSPGSLRGRFSRGDVPAGENVEHTQFENEQVRITRLVCAPGNTVRVTTTDAEPSLLIALSPARLDVTRGSDAASSVMLVTGQERWIPVNQTDAIQNQGSAPAEMLRFDFRTKPVSRRGAEGRGDHTQVVRDAALAPQRDSLRVPPRLCDLCGEAFVIADAV